ncbi:MAG: prolyl-tRNA synthetase associated domain-containing protein [Clostridia bacterium]|nr:prolyl-tRNA synthetase associated domain-containing protein [Clostridia bacterium]
MMQDQEQKVLDYLANLNIPYEIYHHPPVPTVEEAMRYWKDIEATHCKNIFFRNHKGNRHYLVVLRHDALLDIHELEKRLGQGKLSFASSERLMKWLQLTPGSVSPFGLINDAQNHTKLFLDIQLKKATKISFHPNINTASVVISLEDFIKYLNSTGNAYEFLPLYDT